MFSLRKMNVLMPGKAVLYNTQDGKTYAGHVKVLGANNSVDIKWLCHGYICVKTRLGHADSSHSFKPCNHKKGLPVKGRPFLLLGDLVMTAYFNDYHGSILLSFVISVAHGPMGHFVHTFGHGHFLGGQIDGHLSSMFGISV